MKSSLKLATSYLSLRWVQQHVFNGRKRPAPAVDAQAVNIAASLSLASWLPRTMLPGDISKSTHYSAENK